VDRQWHSVRRSAKEPLRADSHVARASVRSSLPSPRHRTPTDEAQASMDQRTSRADEPYDQGGDGQTLPLRRLRSTPNSSRKLRRCLQLRTPPQDTEGAHALRVHLQSMDKSARTIHHRSDPPNAGTKQDAVDGRTDRSICASFRRLHWHHECRPCAWSVRSEHHIGQRTLSAQTGRTSDSKRSGQKSATILTSGGPSTSAISIRSPPTRRRLQACSDA